MRHTPFASLIYTLRDWTTYGNLRHLRALAASEKTA